MKASQGFLLPHFPLRQFLAPSPTASTLEFSSTALTSNATPLPLSLASSPTALAFNAISHCIDPQRLPISTRHILGRSTHARKPPLRTPTSGCLPTVSSLRTLSAGS